MGCHFPAFQQTLAGVHVHRFSNLNHFSVRLHVPVQEKQRSTTDWKLNQTFWLNFQLLLEDRQFFHQSWIAKKRMIGLHKGELQYL